MSNDMAQELGHAIRGSKYLRKLIISNGEGSSSPGLISVFLGLAQNRSIEHLVLKNFDHASLDIFAILSPFFVHNHNLRCIESENFFMSLGMPCLIMAARIPSLIMALMQATKMERIDLSKGIQGDKLAAYLIRALNELPCLSNLSDLSLCGTNIGRLGCKALAALLTNAETKIQVLEIGENEIDDGCMKILVGALVKHSTVKALDLSHQEFVTSVGWCTLSSYVSNQNCPLQRIDLSSNKIGDEGIASLGNSLAINTALKMKYLDLSGCKSVTSTGWNGFSTCLRTANPSLEGLKLDGCEINDQGAVAIATALSGNGSLKTLSLCRNKFVTSAGWIHCFQLLLASGSKSSLEELSLTSNSIDDDGVTLLANWLVSYTSLKVLDLSDIRAISAAGWVGFLRVLVDSHLALEKLFLDGNNVDNDGVALLVNLLANTNTLMALDLSSIPISADRLIAFAEVLRVTPSSSLKELLIPGFSSKFNDEIISCFATALAHNGNLEVLNFLDSGEISMIGWNAMERALCDNASIDTIYNSNHTLYKIFDIDFEQPPDQICYLLEINYNKNKSEVVRAKILKYYFSDVATIGPAFDDVPVTILPSAIAWMGRDGLGFSTLYHLVRGMPSLFLYQAACLRRKLNQ